MASDRMDAMVAAIAELMLGKSARAAANGMLQFYAAAAGAWLGPWEAEERLDVRMIAPVGISHARLYGGRDVVVDFVDRSVLMCESEAKPLERHGWTRA